MARELHGHAEGVDGRHVLKDVDRLPPRKGRCVEAREMARAWDRVALDVADTMPEWSASVRCLPEQIPGR